MRSHPPTAAVVIALTLALSGLAVSAMPDAWIIAGSAPGDYDFNLDPTASTSITAKPGAGSDGFGTLMQKVAAQDYRGSRLRLSARMRTEGAHRAQMWMRVDGRDHKVLAFDNMGSRPVTGSTGWTAYEIVLDVPAVSDAIAFGFFLNGSGKVWADDFRLNKVDATVPLTEPRAGGGVKTQ